MDTQTMIDILRVSDEPQKLAAADELAALLDEEAQLRAENDRLTVKLSAAEKIFNHFGGLAELSKWENGQGETAANVVQEYLEL